MPPARVALAEPSVTAAATAVLAISLIVVFTGISGDWLLCLIPASARGAE